MKQYLPPKITEKIIIKKRKVKIDNTKKNKYLDNILSKKFIKSYF
jgi:hypothetical protein